MLLECFDKMLENILGVRGPDEAAGVNHHPPRSVP